jgi:predicted nuclease of predicted toxin-antitoxin system
MRKPLTHPFFACLSGLQRANRQNSTPRHILEKAHSENWILITSDKDFGEKVYREKRPHRGVVFLRLQDERAASKIQAIDSLLEGYADQLADTLVVVTEKQVRFATP